MKKIVALILSFVLLCSSVSVFASQLGIFSDVDVTSDEGIAILTLYVEGIVKGYGDGTFGVDKPLTRAEFSRMVNLVFGFDGAGMAENVFSDVNNTDWFYEDVLTAVKAGFIVGFEDGTFRGNDNVTRQQACSVVNRIIKLEDAAQKIEITDAVDEWAADDVQLLVNNGYINVEDGGVFRATEDMTRGELALLLAQFVDKSDYTVEVPKETDEDTDEKTEDKDTVNTDSSQNSSAGSSEGSGSVGGSTGGGSNTGSSSGNTGNGNSSKPEDAQEPVDNTEVLKNLNGVLDDINDGKFSGKEKDMIDLIKGAVEATIAAGERGEKLTDDYVTVHFDEEVSKVKEIYNGMTEKERDAFVNKISAFDLETLGYLQEYFLE